ncbi:MAG: hypothetical protein ACLT74_13200, partial [Christensenellales bacterium]
EEVRAAAGKIKLFWILLRRLPAPLPHRRLVVPLGAALLPLTNFTSVAVFYSARRLYIRCTVCYNRITKQSEGSL